MTRTYKVTIARQVEVDVELKMIHAGAPMVPPSLSHPGDPPEPPEFDLVSFSITDLTEEEQADALEAALEQAYEDEWHDRGTEEDY